MGLPDHIKEEWDLQQRIAKSYHCRVHPQDPGIYGFDIISNWSKYIRFSDFVESHEFKVQKSLRNGEDHGTSMPRIASNHITRFKHPEGYHIFKKRTTIATEEWAFSQFAKACGFPYAPILLDDQSFNLYTPKLGNNVTSVFGFVKNAIKNGDDTIPLALKVSFNKALRERGSVAKIPYREFLRLKISFLPTKPSRESEAYEEWVNPLYQRERTFISNMRAILSLMGSGESYKNGTNIIVNAQTGRFLYAIDQHPAGESYYFSMRPTQRRRDDIFVDSSTDPEVVRAMQEVMKEKITDELIDDMMDVVRAYTYSSFGVGDLFEVKRLENNISAHKDELKRRRDNPVAVLDPATMKLA